MTFTTSDSYASWVEAFGPLTPCKHSYYSKCAETVLDTEQRITAEGVKWWLRFMVADYEEATPIEELTIIADLWWVPPATPGTAVGKTLKGPGEYKTFGLDQAALAVSALEAELVKVQEECRQMMLRKEKLTLRKGLGGGEDDRE